MTNPTEQANKDSRAVWLATLDAGIRPHADILDAAGVETFESCEGGEGHHFPEPTVRFCGGRAEGFRALAVALQVGPLPVRTLRWREIGQEHAFNINPQAITRKDLR